MQKYSELKYIQQLNLPKLKRVQSGYVCSCTICKEGSSPHKTRMYFLTENKTYITIFCHHCGYSTNLKTFIKEYHPHIYQEYIKEEREELLSDLKTGNLFQKERKKSDINNINLQYKFKLNEKYFRPAYKYKEAVEFCKRRKILDHINKLYYNIHPKHILSGMVIFPFLLEDQETLYGFQGRSTSVKLFHNFLKNDSMKVYNLFNIDLNEQVYVFESIIDSLMVENSIAMLGTSLSGSVKTKLKKFTYIFDDDRVGLYKTLQYLKEGNSVCIFPDSFHYKDFNEAVCDGFKRENLPKLIRDNTYQGLLGETKIQFKLMRKR